MPATLAISLASKGLYSSCCIFSFPEGYTPEKTGTADKGFLISACVPSSNIIKFSVKLDVPLFIA